jgi:hypothetical protein
MCYDVIYTGVYIQAREASLAGAAAWSGGRWFAVQLPMREFRCLRRIDYAWAAQNSNPATPEKPVAFEENLSPSEKFDDFHLELVAFDTGSFASMRWHVERFVYIRGQKPMNGRA